MHKIRLAVIGSGWVVENRHLPALRKNDSFEVVAIVGRKQDKLARLARKFSIPRIVTGDATVHTDWLAACDAVMIGTDPMNHYHVASFCLTHGKHVLMEKPLTTSKDDSQKLYRLVKRTRLTFAIVHNFQFSRASVSLDGDLTQGNLGKTKGLYAFQLGSPYRRLPTWYEKLPWGLFYDESPHLLYLLDKYGKGLRVTSATKSPSTIRKSTPALITTLFQTSIGVPASLYLNFESPVSEWYMAVIGTKAIGIIDIFRDLYIKIPNDGRHASADIFRTSFVTISQHIAGTIKSGLKVLQNDYLCGNEKVVDIFANAILYKTTLSPIGIEDALKINRLQWEIMSKTI